jgi:hypothetical protein
LTSVFSNRLHIEEKNKEKGEDKCLDSTELKTLSDDQNHLTIFICLNDNVYLIISRIRREFISFFVRRRADEVSRPMKSF